MKIFPSPVVIRCIVEDAPYFRTSTKPVVAG
nr:MAG TPA: hypothetical protein [Siphoviridae sp. ctIyp7]